MLLLGLLVMFAGFGMALASLGLTGSVGARLVLVLAGIAVSLFGMIGLINRTYLKNAIWKR